MNKRARKYTLQPHHVSLFAFFVAGLVLTLLFIPIRALLNVSDNALRFTSLATYGGTGTDTVYDIDLDENGDQYISGYFNNSLTLGETTHVSEGGNDAVLYKRSPSGEILWSKTGGGAGSDIFTVADYFEGAVYTSAYFTGDFTVDGQTYTSFGLNDLVLAKYDADDGALIWRKHVGSASNEFADHLQVGPDGYIYWSGMFYSTVTFGATELTSNGNADSYIAKYNTEGVLQWVKQGSSSGQDRAYNFDFFPNGNLAVVGYYYDTMTYGALSVDISDTTDAYLLIMEPDGDFVSLYAYGDTSGDEQFSKVDVDDQSRVYAHGYYSSTTWQNLGGITWPQVGGQDAGIVRIDPADGSVVWAQSVAGTGTESLLFTDVDDTNARGLLMSFSYSNNAVYDGTTYPANGTTDVMLVSLNPSTGSAYWTKRYTSSAADTMRGFAWTGSLLHAGGGTGDGGIFDSFTTTAVGGSDQYVGILAYPNLNEYTAVPEHKPGIFSLQAHAQRIADRAVLYRYRLKNDGESVLYTPHIKDRSCPTASVRVGRGDQNGNGDLDPGETWDLFCLKKSFPYFPRTVTAEAQWQSSVSSSYTVVDNEEVPYVEPVSEQTEDPVTLSVFKETEGIGTNPPSLLYVLQAKEGSKKPVVTDEGCESLTPLWKDKDGMLKKGETWVLLCVPKKDAEQKPVLTM